MRELAEACDIPFGTYADAERGRTDFTLTRLLKVVKYLDINIFNTYNPENEKSESVLVSIDTNNINDFFSLLIKQSASHSEEILEIKKQNEELKSLLAELIAQKKEGKE